MRETLPPPSEHPTASAATPAPAPVQMAGRRSGEGAASVLEHLLQDRMRYADRNAARKELRS